MARETHPPPSSERGGGLPGLHIYRRERLGRAYELRGDPTRGAALEAPTAPHATFPVARGKDGGPARFWDARRIRIALYVAFSISLVFHLVMAPWKLLPSGVDVEMKDADGELAIPIDILGEEPPPPDETPPPTTQPPPDNNDPNGPNAQRPDAAAPRKDAGPPKDASVADAESLDGGLLAENDAGASDAGYDGSLLAMGDASAEAGAPGPVDPTAGVATLNTGPQNIVLVVNSAVIRKHPVGSRMGPVIQQIPQWKDFLKGSQSTMVDPIQSTDWILIYGPSLIHTDRDAVLVKYNVSDAVVDAAVDAVAKSYDKGGPYDAGVPGVPASRGHADNAERIFMRPQAKLLVIAPPAHAYAAAKTYQKNTPRAPNPKEAMHLVVRNPSQQIAIPQLKFKDSLKEIQLWIEPRSDGGADIHAIGNCTDEQAAIDAADALNALVKNLNVGLVRAFTKHMLDGVNVVPTGSKVRLDHTVTQEQLEAILQLVAARVGANVAPAGGGRTPE